MEEIWKDIDGFENKYQISNFGRVKSLVRKGHPKEIILSLTHTCSSGYRTVGLYKNSKRYEKSIHRLVANAFIPNPNKYPEINHIDENKFNNCANNLEWCTRKYNSLHNNLAMKTAEIKKKNGFYSNMKEYRTGIINLTTGEIFESMYAVGKKYAPIFNISKQAIIVRLYRLRNKNNENIECLGYKWRFYKYNENNNF